MSAQTKTLSLLLFLLFHGVTWAKDIPTEATSQISLQDLAGKKKTFQKLTQGLDLIALVSISVDCPMVQKSFPKYEKSFLKWKNKKVLYVFIDSSPKLDLIKIKKQKEQYSVSIPIYLDEDQKLAKLFGFVSTNQVLLLDPRKSRVIYDGALDSSLNFSMAKSNPEPYLENAITEHLAGTPVSKPQTESFGCAITFKPSSF